ncbi:MAG: extracellular solute-binding protein [Clostridiales bacterium]|nr:extracellular solute-binding protein [Clostridiales bacterium]
MKRGIGILLTCVMLLSGCTGKQGAQAEKTKKEDGVIHLYTLKDNDQLWQSAKLFEEKFPEYQVVIDVGVSEEDGKTVSDAIRSLNTEIMAGNGPDIILMDGLPIEDYIEKGVLEDLSDMVESVKENGEEFFENVLSSYEKGEKVYAIPSRFSVPIIIGKEGAVTLEEVKTLSGTLKTRTEEQIKGITRNATKSIPLLLLTFWNDIISEESVVDQEALSTFLEEARMLFDASEIDLELPYYQEVSPFQEMIDTYPNYSGDAGVTMAFQKDILSVDEMDMGQTLAQLESVSANSPVFYDYLNSESGKKFIPKWIFGITASSEKKEAAKAFLSYFLSSENMDQYDWTLSVNKTSFRKTLPISETKEQMTVMYPEQDSAEGIRIQKLNAEEAEEFVNFLSEADTKIAVEQALFEEILTQAEHYVYGEESLESAVNAIVEKIEIYQAE